MQARRVPVYSDRETKPDTRHESKDKAGDSRNTAPSDTQDSRGQEVSLLAGDMRQRGQEVCSDRRQEVCLDREDRKQLQKEEGGKEVCFDRGGQDVDLEFRGQKVCLDREEKICSDRRQEVCVDSEDMKYVQKEEGGQEVCLNRGGQEVDLEFRGQKLGLNSKDRKYDQIEDYGY